MYISKLQAPLSEISEEISQESKVSSMPSGYKPDYDISRQIEEMVYQGAATTEKLQQEVL